MNTVIVKIYISDKCNTDWMQSNRQQRTAAVKELKQAAADFDRTLHCAVLTSPTLERGEAFAEILHSGELPYDLQTDTEAVIHLLAQDATQENVGMRFVMKVVDVDVDIIYRKLDD